MGDVTGTASNNLGCPYCGMGHGGTCPRVKAIDYHENGTVKRVEFHDPQPIQTVRLTADDLHALKAR